MEPVAVTSRLFIGGCPFPHTVCGTASQAVEAIRRGETAVVGTYEEAGSALIRLGVPMASRRVILEAVRLSLADPSGT